MGKQHDAKAIMNERRTWIECGIVAWKTFRALKVVAA